MGEVVVFAVIASSALVVGAVIGVVRPPSQRITAVLLGFASGALISAMAFELFQGAVVSGGPWRAGVALLIGATTFVVVDVWLTRRTERRQESGATIGFALVTLDGVPENLALGVSLIEAGSLPLLIAIFASNLPEAIVGARKMDESGLEKGRVVGIWVVAAVLLAVAVIVGFAALDRLDEVTLAWPLGFAGGAVLASLADTLMPEAYQEGGPTVAYATALGFLLSFLLSSV
ncbi:MAG: zinc permease [Acidimicrobiia bacterium]|nr:zinc permease [Acidimicrobiia bacterium]